MKNLNYTEKRLRSQQYTIKQKGYLPRGLSSLEAENLIYIFRLSNNSNSREFVLIQENFVSLENPQINFWPLSFF